MRIFGEEMLVGIDDTDSRKGMCTTYLCAVIVDELKARGFAVSMPYLVRLNPVIPFKTRGNGAVSFEVGACGGTTASNGARGANEANGANEVNGANGGKRASWENDVRDVVVARMRDLAEIDDENTHPGAVFAYERVLKEICADDVKKRMLAEFYTRAVKTVLNIDDALRTISALDLDLFMMKRGRGIIGALAALSFAASRDLGVTHDITYELIAYRCGERWGKPREIDEESVWEAHRVTYPLTWDTVDEANRKIVFAPHSPCPVLFGIRGDSIDAISSARSIVRSEPTEREMMFITNQGTDAHLLKFCTETHELKEFHSYEIDGVVVEPPRNLRGGHVVFTIAVMAEGDHGEMRAAVESSLADAAAADACDACDAWREIDRMRINCIAYEPTKQFRDVVRRLIVGDEVVVFGSLKRDTINLEKLFVKRLVRHVLRNPRCPSCGKRMESAGRGKGFRCRRCGTYSAESALERIERAIEEGCYEVPPSARRHISKPLVRIRRAAHVSSGGKKKVFKW